MADVRTCSNNELHVPGRLHVQISGSAVLVRMARARSISATKEPL
jgi:hypothetical protein